MLNRLQWLRLVAAFALAIGAVSLVRASRSGRLTLPSSGGDTAVEAAVTRSSHSAPQAVPPSFAPTSASGSPAAVPVPTVQPNLVGIVPGHWEFDSGAVCADGRKEVDVTTDVALRVRALLEYRGYEVDLLPEHDPDEPEPPLEGYRGAALVSIHADSCDIAGASGYKVARWRHSLAPERDDDLVACLQDAYGVATLLPRHEGSVTVDMWNYYAFREIAPETPAAIIELGFLQADRDVLDANRYEMALGIANGVTCFLGGG